MKPAFLYELNSRVALTESGEEGRVTARGEYLNSEPQYLVAWKGADGCQRHDWWPESLIQSAEQKAAEEPDLPKAAATAA